MSVLRLALMIRIDHLANRCRDVMVLLEPYGYLLNSFLQHAERLALEIFTVHIFGIQDVAQFVAGETIETRIVRVRFCAEMRAALFIPLERRQCSLIDCSPTELIAVNLTGSIYVGLPESRIRN
jgi:hypothetical protein